MKMKKLVFTIQVFCLMVMFPVYIIVELNRGTGKATINNSSSDCIEKMVKK